LNCRTTTTATTGAAGSTTLFDYIPKLTEFCPEASISFKQLAIIVQGNTSQVGVGDANLNWYLDTSASLFSSDYYQGDLISGMWFRLVCTSTFTTDSSHAWYVYGNTTVFNHLQAYMNVVYTFSATDTSVVLNSIQLPVQFSSLAGGIDASSYQRATTEFYIQEPSTIVVKDSGLLLFWDQISTVSGLNARIGTATFTTYTDATNEVCGGNGLIMKNVSLNLNQIVLTRGKNTLSADVYRTDTADLMFGLTGLWMINYHSGKSTFGVGAHNQTINWNIFTIGSSTASYTLDISAMAPIIPETNYYLNSMGVHYYNNFTYTSGQYLGESIFTERLISEGGNQWIPIYIGLDVNDQELGVRQFFSDCKKVFIRWPGEPSNNNNTIDIETSRRWRIQNDGSSTACISQHYLDMLLTYHGIYYTVSGNVSGSAGGTVNIDLLKDSTGEKLLTTSRVSNGAYSFNWYDNTEDVYTSAREDSTHLGRSEKGKAV
jgi:hypothetical protein